MRIAVGRRGDELANSHFGYAEFFSIFDVTDSGAAELVQTRLTGSHCGDDGGDQRHLAETVAALADCVAVVAARIGPCARRQLAEFDILAAEADGPGLVGCEWLLAAVRSDPTG